MSRATTHILFLIVAVASSAYAQAGKLIKARAPEPATIPGYVRGHCVAIPNRVRVCKMFTDADDIFIVEKDGQRIGSWPTTTYFGETSSFEVLRGDLDGDRRTELIVANHDGTSNGLGVEFWTIAVFSDSQFHSFRPPLTFSVEEYGTRGTFVSDGRRVNILTTLWRWTSDPKRKRGEGLYLVGQWWRYRAGTLSPVFGRPSLARRYLVSFAKERGETMQSPRVPYQWLTDNRSEQITLESTIGPARSVKVGTIQSVSSVSEKILYRTVNIDFKPEGEQSITYRYPEEDELLFLGDLRSGRLYPSRYLPSQPEAWLRGKRATLRTYGEGTERRNFQVLWVEP